jgi:hypothetical protein
MFKYFVAFLIFCFGPIIAHEQEAFESRYIETMALTFQAFEQQGSESIWPHFHLAGRPTVFHFKNGHVYAFGLKRSSPRWESRLVQQHPLLFCEQYPVALAPLHPAFPVEQQRAFVFSLDHGNDSSFFPLLTFIHERFHLHQFQFFKREKVAKPVSSDYQDVYPLALMELENRLLKQFLEATETKAKMESLKDYLAVSHIRRQQLHPASQMWEDHQQKMEGLADYVSVKTYEVFSYLPQFKAESALLEMRTKKTVGLASLAEDAIKGRHYFVGATLGWALDYCQVPNWKMRIERENISLQALLEEVLFMGDVERQGRLASVQSALNWNQIQADIRQQLDREKREIAQAVQDFEQQEGILVQMGLPSGHLSAGGQNVKTLQIDQAKALWGDTSLSTSQDQSWILRFKAMPLLLEEQNGHRTFKLNPEATIQVDGQKMSLAEIVEKNVSQVPFSSLSLQDEHCELQSTRSGKIVVQDKCVSFLFD